MSQFFVTYQWNSDRRNKYSLIEAENYFEALEIARKATNNRYFVYPIRELEAQKREYFLSEVPLGEANKLEDTDEKDFL